MSELDARKQSILRAIIVEYVDAAEPVGSEALVQKFGLGVKSATVRNEMAEMLDLGYLEQPHTSAGRIPSDFGYRYYVDRLIVQRPVADESKRVVHDASMQGDALQLLLQDTLRALSRITQYLGVATTLRDTTVEVRAAVLSALGPQNALLVLALNNGHVENKMIEMPPGTSLEDIGLANEQLAAQLTGKSLDDLRKFRGNGALANEKLAGLLVSTIRGIAQRLTRGKVIIEGEEFLFALPEFKRDSTYMTEVLRELSDTDALYDSIAQTDGTQFVTIGRENRHPQLRHLSVVRESFHVGETRAGVIALIGPTRMQYDTSIPLVNFTAQAISSSLSRFF